MGFILLSYLLAYCMVKDLFLLAFNVTQDKIVLGKNIGIKIELIFDLLNLLLKTNVTRPLFTQEFINDIEPSN